MPEESTRVRCSTRQAPCNFLDNPRIDPATTTLDQQTIWQALSAARLPLTAITSSATGSTTGTVRTGMQRMAAEQARTELPMWATPACNERKLRFLDTRSGK